MAATTRPKPVRHARRPMDKVTWESPYDSVTVVHVPMVARDGWQQQILLSSDRHWDNPASDRAMQKRHLDEMVKRDAYCVDNGDMLCVMQGKFDKRSSKKDILPEHAKGAYLDAVVDTCADWFAPWADRLIMLGTGNHEQAVNERSETNLIDRICERINSRHGGKVLSGGFGGFVKFHFHGETGFDQSLTMHHDHGYGGGGPVTKDTIQHQRRQNYLPDADIITSGHTHDAWSMFSARKRLTQGNKIKLDEVLHVKTPTYKDDYKDGHGGWHATRGMPPKSLGAYWLVFTFSGAEQRIKVDAQRAS
jgi:hypothetical protein